MLNYKFLSALSVGLCVVSLSMAQNADISPARKQAIDSLALEKVRDLSKYISIIGNKKTPFSEATRVMDRAEELFAPDSEIVKRLITTKSVSILNA